MNEKETLHLINIEDKLNATCSLKFLNWMDSSEAAIYMRVSVGSLRNMVSQGQIRSYKLGRRLRFKRSELDKAMELSTQGEPTC